MRASRDDNERPMGRVLMELEMVIKALYGKHATLEILADDLLMFWLGLSRAVAWSLHHNP